MIQDGKTSVDFQKYIKGISLSDIQISSAQKTFNSKGILLGLSCGLGKTITILSVCEALRERHDGLCVCIVCPKSARSAFMKELSSKLVNEPDFAIVGTDAPKGYEYKNQPYVIIELPSIKKFACTLKSIVQTRETVLVVDEAHTALVNPKTQSAKILGTLRNSFFKRYALTASPLLNSIDSLFWVYSFVSDNPEFENYYAFRNKYCILQEREVSIYNAYRLKKKLPLFKRKVTQCVGYKNLDELKDPLEECSAFGAIRYNIEYHFPSCKLDDALKDEYLQATKGLKADMDDDDVEASHGSRLVSLQYIVDGCTTNQDWYTCNKEKLLIGVLKTIRDRDEGTIIYSDYTETITRLVDLLDLYKDELDIDNIFVLDGSTKSKTRISIEHELSNRDVLIISPAGRVSINLQSVNNMIFYDIPFSQAGAEQAIGRICRCDSTYDKQNVYLLEVEGTIDTYKRILFKRLSSFVNELFDGLHPTLPTTLMAEENKTRAELKRSFLWHPNL